MRFSNSGVDRVYVTPRKHLIANILINQYWVSIKEQLRLNPGSCVRLKLSQVKKLLKSEYFDPDISDKTAREALEIFTERCLKPSGYLCKFSSGPSTQEVFFEIWKDGIEEAIHD